MIKITSMAALLAVSLTAAQAQTVITDWTFDNYANASGTIVANPAPSTGAGTASALGFNNSYNSTTSVSSPDIIVDVAGSSANGLNDWRLRGQSPGNGWSSQAPIGTQGAQFSVSTVGYSGISLTFDVSTTKQAEANLEVLFTTDGINWHNATISPFTGANTATVLNNTTSANTVMGSYIKMQNSNGGWYDGITANFGAAASNNPNFGVEIVNASTGADDLNQAGTAYNNNSGNWRIDNVSIQGVPEPSTLALAALGLTTLFLFRQRQQRKA